MENKYKIYLIEDDNNLVEEIIYLLNRWSYYVKIPDNFENIIEDIKSFNPHIILMDINLPCYDGFYWCRMIRKVSNVPVIYLSSRDSSMDVVRAIDSGGDDYITKPFDNDIFIAKISAVCRRNYEMNGQQLENLTYKELNLDLEKMLISTGEGEQSLTKNEFKILKILFERPGKVVSRQELMRSLWNDDIYVNENTLTVNVNRLRSKLLDLCGENLIETKKGVGYKLQ